MTARITSARRRSGIGALLVGASIAIAGVGGGTAIAAPTSAMLGITPAQDATCRLSPLTLPLFGGTPVAIGTPVATALSVGTPASEDEIAAIEDATATIVACINTGDPKLVYAVFTEHYLAETYGNPETAYLPAFEQSLDGVAIPVTPAFVLDEVADVTALADGRIAATITLSQDGASVTDTLVFAEVDGVWLIDEVAE